jgi:hypothetical protein
LESVCSGTLDRQVEPALRSRTQRDVPEGEVTSNETFATELTIEDADGRVGFASGSRDRVLIPLGFQRADESYDQRTPP